MKLFNAFFEKLKSLRLQPAQVEHKVVDAYNVDLREINSLANSGNAIALFALSQILERGINCDVDFDRSLSLLKESAAADFPPALNELAERYSQGVKGVDKDLVKSFALFRRSAQQGDFVAQYNIGISLLHGIGVDSDNTFAAYWLEQSATQNHAESQYALGVLYADGLGVEKDTAKAADLYGKAASQGIAKAKYNLGLLYLSGTGVSQSYEDAFFWLLEAAEQGIANAQHNVAILYEQGTGTVKNEHESLSWHLKAAASGILASQFKACDLLANSAMIRDLHSDTAN